MKFLLMIIIDIYATVMLPLNTIQMCAYFYIVNYKYICEEKQFSLWRILS